MAMTDHFDLKLLVGTLVQDEPELFMDIDKLLKREEMLKKEEEKSEKKQ